MGNRGVKGRRVLLTRTREDCVLWAEELSRSGATVVTLPCIECQPVETPESRERLIRALSASDWLVFTSRRGVSEFHRLAGSESPSLRIAAVGPATAAAAKHRFGRVDLVSEGGNARELARELAQKTPHPARFLIVVAENAGTALETILSEQGAKCVRINVYRTVPVASAGPRRPLSTLGVDTVLLASPSAVSGFRHQVEMDRLADIFTIGPSTSQEARRSGLAVTAEATRPSLEGLLEAME